MNKLTVIDDIKQRETQKGGCKGSKLVNEFDIYNFLSLGLDN